MPLTPDRGEPIMTPDGVHRDPWTLWVRCDGTGATWPYLLGEQSAKVVSALAAGEGVPPGCHRSLNLLRCRRRSRRCDTARRGPSRLGSGHRDDVGRFTHGDAAIAGLVPRSILACRAPRIDA